MAIAPWAKLTTPVPLKTTTRPSANEAYSAPRPSPTMRNRRCTLIAEPDPDPSAQLADEARRVDEVGSDRLLRAGVLHLGQPDLVPARRLSRPCAVIARDLRSHEAVEVDRLVEGVLHRLRGDVAVDCRQDLREIHGVGEVVPGEPVDDVAVSGCGHRVDVQLKLFL